MTRYGLTAHQDQLFRFVESEITAGRRAPSFAEMRDFMGCKAKSSIHRLIEGLVERGALVRLPGRARALALPGTAGEVDLALVALKAEQAKMEAARAAFAAGLPDLLQGELLAYARRHRRAPSEIVTVALADYMRRHP